MEKISNIVRGSSRVASVDVKGSAAVRPGAPSFGRPMGESSAGPLPAETTAARAVAIHNEMNEAKKVRSQDVMAAQLADSFFMSRIRRPADEEVTVTVPQPPVAKEEVEAPEMEAAESGQPSGYVPRGSYVNVHA